MRLKSNKCNYKPMRIEAIHIQFHFLLALVHEDPPSAEFHMDNFHF